MNFKIAGAIALAVAGSSSAALAGGLERAIPSVSILFEDNTYLEFSGSFVLPELDGDDGVIPPGFPGAGATLSGNTGDLLDNYFNLGAAFKADITDELSYALIINQPLGANSSYPTGTSASPLDVRNVYGGSGAELVSVAATALLAYDVTDRVKVYAGPVVQFIDADASLSFLSDYNVDADPSFGYGFTVGAAYSVPDIALRVALTYRSAIAHDLDTEESSTALGTNETDTDIDTPQSLTLDFQTGIAADTLLFGQVHWVDWSDFDISPPNYLTLTGGRPLVAYEEDWIIYTLGVGRRFTDTWSGAFSVNYEPQTDTELTSLGPVDGRIGLNVGATYETDRYKVSGGVNYTFLGDARNVLDTDFDDGSAIGVGFRVGFKL
ncbi:MAG: outer membrane protein transport protein [Pseudomonadota bacterium]